MRVCTWNINGLRAICARFGGLKALLDTVGADIVCFQETKLQRSELERELAVLDGWESFFSFCSCRTGYSGVATFVRKAAAGVPLACEQGLTGALLAAGAEAAAGGQGGDGAAAAALQTCVLLQEQLGVGVEQLQAMDAEGRAVVTDHGPFVLVNVYGPALSADDKEKLQERLDFKLSFYKVLEARLRAWLAAGRAVLLVGDLNISPQPIDSCAPGPPAEFASRPDRLWLNSLLGPAGLLVDLFRHFHPTRTGAYSCWNTASGARVNNWGTRIDHILAAGLAPPAAAAAAAGLAPLAAAEEQHPPAAPAAAAAAAAATSLASLATGCDVRMEQQGSDHAPVFADFALPPSVFPVGHAAPPCAASRLFPGRQASLKAWLQPASQAGRSNNISASSSGSALRGMQAQAQQPAGAGVGQEASGSQQQQQQQPQPSVGAAAAAAAGRPSSALQPAAKKARTAAGGKAGKGGELGKGQKSLFSFVTKGAAAPPAAAAAAAAAAVTASSSQHSSQLHPGSNMQLQGEQLQASQGFAWQQQAKGDSSSSGASMQLAMDAIDASTQLASQQQQQPQEQLQEQAWTELEDATRAARAQQQQAAAARWRVLSEKMKPPKCTGHGEPCVIRTVKKKNSPNIGRQFYCCARPDGRPPIGRCRDFIWVDGRGNIGGGGGKPGASKR